MIQNVNTQNEVFIYVISAVNPKYTKEQQICQYPFTFNLKNSSYSVPCDEYFTKNGNAVFKLSYNSVDDKQITSVDDIESIDINFHYKSKPNEFKKKKEIKEHINLVIKKRSDEINELKKERDEINTKLEKDDYVDEQIKVMYKDIELINNQIKNHHKEITKIKNDIINEVEVGDEEIDYYYTLHRNKIEHISDLPAQTKNFSLIWITNNNFESKSKKEPTTKITNKKIISVSYEDLAKIS